MLRRHPSARLILEIDVCACPFLSLTIKQSSVYSAVQGAGSGALPLCQRLRHRPGGPIKTGQQNGKNAGEKNPIESTGPAD